MTPPRTEKPSPLGRRWRARAPDEGKMPGRCPSSVTCGDTLRGEGDVMPLAANTQPRNFNPRPPRGGRLPKCGIVFRPESISIHVLREENDCSGGTVRAAGLHFNPRPPRGGRPSPHPHQPSGLGFQSTSSARRTTRLPVLRKLPCLFQSTSSARRTTTL